MIPEGEWIRKDSGAMDLWVNAQGPTGSGRYWKITIGVSENDAERPERGVCLGATTLGWRTLQEIEGGGLAWIDDVDHDGKFEILLWDSFPLREEASAAEQGLVAWVYRLDGRDELQLDMTLSRQMAKRIAASYRSPLKNPSAGLSALRAQAAAALAKFADGGCNPVRKVDRTDDHFTD